MSRETLNRHNLVRKTEQHYVCIMMLYPVATVKTSEVVPELRRGSPDLADLSPCQ